ncbi:hypothetical protein TKK_0011783 [Trichogramma kaykai]|uniref:Short/branched chain specific acyl-CoA dehydrogenase, mitochondrial n=1 Tax=Trichogramma kaykai TaxID=54128 RepID=A0ABD2WQ33_9HYME
MVSCRVFMSRALQINRSSIGRRSLHITATHHQSAPGPLTRLTEDERLLQESVRRLAQDKLLPRVRAMEQQGRVDQDVLDQLFQAGLMGAELEPEIGGSGCGFLGLMLAVEELARVDASLAVLVDIQNTLVVAIIRRFGTEEQRRRYLPLLAQSWVGSFCLSEAGSGSDAFALSCKAKKDSQGQYVIDGSKLWISNSDVAKIFVVFARLEGTGPADGHRGVTAFLVERDTPGLEIARPERKLGLEASGTCALQFNGVKAQLLGEAGVGYRYAAALLNESRVGIGAQMIGLARGCLDATLPYLMERRQFGQPIWGFQSVQHQVARMATELECSRLLVYNAARCVEAGEDVRMPASMAKLHSSEMAQRVASQCIDLMGGLGFTKDYPQEKFYRDCKAGTIYEGTSNMQLTTIAKCIEKIQAQS